MVFYVIEYLLILIFFQKSWCMSMLFYDTFRIISLLPMSKSHFNPTPSPYPTHFGIPTTPNHNYEMEKPPLPPTRFP